MPNQFLNCFEHHVMSVFYLHGKHLLIRDMVWEICYVDPCQILRLDFGKSLKLFPMKIYQTTHRLKEKCVMHPHFDVHSIHTFIMP